jgi:hemolysin III
MRLRGAIHERGAMGGSIRQPHAAEELVNALTHGVGAAASVVGAIVVIWVALATGEAGYVVGATVYGVALVLLYTASTLYHSARREALKRRLRVLDHCAIYVFIAATYTPLAVVALSGVWRWVVLGGIWGIAAAGVVYKLFLLGRFPRFSTFTYLGMGWLAVIALPLMLGSLDAATIAWIVAGGIAYSAGTIFFHTERIRFAHGIWHGFVLTGSVCHYLAIVGLLTA